METSSKFFRDSLAFTKGPHGYKTQLERLLVSFFQGEIFMKKSLFCEVMLFQ